MAILKNSCCGCCNVRQGSIVVGVLFLILHLIDLGIKANNMSSMAAAGYSVSGTDAASVAIDVVAIVIDALMIYGVIKAISTLLLVWVVFVVIILVAELIIVIVVTVIALGLVGASAASPGAQGGAFGFILLILIPVWIIYILILLLVIYGVLVVYSHYQNLRDGVVDDGSAPPPGAYPLGNAAPPPGGVYPQAGAAPPSYEMQQGIPQKV
ncbi:uncharacterized protein LOC144884482 [Branchiostoma floridae x Branchiostoma japonicum]